MCTKFRIRLLKNDVDIWSFIRKTCVLYVVVASNYLVFIAGSSFCVMFHLIFNIGRSDLRILRGAFYGQTALKYLQSPRSEKKRKKKKSYGNARLFLAFLMACGWWGHVFATSANPRSGKKKVVISPSFTVRGGEYDTKCVTIEWMVQAAF